MEISQHTKTNTVIIHRSKSFPQSDLINLLTLSYSIYFKHTTLRPLRRKVVVRVEGLEPPRLTDLFFHFISNLRHFLDVRFTQLYLPVNPRCVPFEAKCVPNVSTTDRGSMDHPCRQRIVIIQLCQKPLI